RSGLAFLSPQLLDLLRWGRSLSTAKASRLLGFRAARDTRTAFDDYIQQRRVLRYEPDRHAYQYEKELEDFIHSRQPVPVNGETSNDESVETKATRRPNDLPRRPALAPQR